MSADQKLAQLVDDIKRRGWPLNPDDAAAVARLNAETLAGMQDALRKSEAREAMLVGALKGLLLEIGRVEGDAERFILPPSPHCPACTHGVSQAIAAQDRTSQKVCPRHAAESAVRS